MKKFAALTILVLIMLSLTACGQKRPVQIVLSDGGITVNGETATSKTKNGVFISNDIVFYLEGQGGSYGEGSSDEEHPQAEADKHTVINITKPGDYEISGNISYGQLAVNLGENVDNNRDKKVNITLNNADITCTVAPAIICYSAYECCSDDLEDATKDVNTVNAGFNITLADGSVNNINGSHVAKILDEDGKKLHKYDAAIESLVSMNINGAGVLNLVSDNEGIETKLHITINGGVLNINSQDDAVNAGEDGVSVITVNNGTIMANSNNGAEGDGMDSNGWIVINGGHISAFASDRSMDSGLDSDNGIYINSGDVYATGSMYDTITKDSLQNVMVMNFDSWVLPEEYLLLKNSAGENVAAFNSTASAKVIVFSSPRLTEGEYTLYKATSITGDKINGIYTNITAVEGLQQLAHTGTGTSSFSGRPMGEMPQNPKDMQQFFKGEMPENMPQPPEGGFMMPDGKEPPEMPQGEKDRPVGFGGEGKFDYGETVNSKELNRIFNIEKGVNNFRRVQPFATDLE